MEEYVLMTYYMEYLKKIRKVSDSAIRHYQQAMQSIESAKYECEINSKHKTFTAKSTGMPYMEGHHMLPMKYQDRFKSSLDVYANIICLCPICHRLLHYGVTL